MNDIKICAAITTFNRLTLLKVCIESLRNQLYPLDQIIVMNNGSVDETEDWLRSQSDIVVLSQKVNNGASNGFFKAIKEGYERGYDWIWAMDDDAFPAPDCLKNLVENDKFSPGKDVVLAPVVVEGERVNHMHRGFVNLSKEKPQGRLQEKTTDDILINGASSVDISFVSFVGMFLGRKVVETVGYPDIRYFIFNDDVEYSIRITSNGFPIYLIPEAIIFHKTNNLNPDFSLQKLLLANA